MSTTSKRTNKKTTKNRFAKYLKESMKAFACSADVLYGNYRPYSR